MQLGPGVICRPNRISHSDLSVSCFVIYLTANEITLGAFSRKIQWALVLFKIIKSEVEVVLVFIVTLVLNENNYITTLRFVIVSIILSF